MGWKKTQHNLMFKIALDFEMRFFSIFFLYLKEKLSKSVSVQDKMKQKRVGINLLQRPGKLFVSWMDGCLSVGCWLNVAGSGGRERFKCYKLKLVSFETFTCVWLSDHRVWILFLLSSYCFFFYFFFHFLSCTKIILH